jgi:hypothetical protein
MLIYFWIRMGYLAKLILYFGLIGFISSKVIINSTKLSTARASVSSIQAGDKIYIAGGFEYDDLVASDIIDVYSVIDNGFLGNEALPHPRSNISPVVLGQHIYFIGGNEYNNKPFIYSEEEGFNFSRAITSPPNLRAISEISLHNGTLTAVGKWHIDFYDTYGNTWNTSDSLNSILQSLQGPLVIAVEKYVFILGGRSSTTAQLSNMLHVFNKETASLISRETIALEAADSITYHYNNDVLVLHSNQTLLLYHVKRNAVQIRPQSSPFYFATSTANATYVFPKTMRGVSTYHWDFDGSAGRLDYFYHAFGFGEHVGFVSKDTDIGYPTVWILVNGLFTSLVNDPDLQALDWSLPLTGYDWPPSRHIISDGFSILIFDMDALTLSSFVYSKIEKIFVDAQNDTAYVFGDSETDTSITCIYSIVPFLGDFQSTGYSCIATPDLMFHDHLLYVTDGFIGQWPSGTPLNSFDPIDISRLLVAQTEDQLVMMLQYPDLTLSRIIDVFDYVNGTWLDSVDMPPELSGDASNNVVSATVNDRAITWFRGNRLEISSPETYVPFIVTASGNRISLTFGNSWNYPVHSQLAVIIDDAVYLKSADEGQYLQVYSSETDSWKVTTSFPPDFPAIEPMQLFVFARLIYVIAKVVDKNQFDYVYFYDVDSKVWQITQPTTELQDNITAAKIGDFLALFSTKGKMFSLHVPSGQWFEDDFPYNLLFSNVAQTDASVTFLSGATSMVDGRYSGVMLILTDDGTVPVVPQSTSSNVTAPIAGDSADNTTLIVAIVVPIGAVAITGGLLAFFLVRRHKKHKRRDGGASSTIGLETKYGQWFIPFDQIKFGEQLGQGGNGQVFKGTWKNTTVALKVSMTQANSSVLGELELMMKMRPHPNVVQLLGFSIHPETDSVILIIEYCDQGSLDSTLFNVDKHVTREQQLHWISSAAKGLSHLHSNNIVHRDVASRNVLLHQNEPKITDFGMSREVNQESKKGTTKSELGPIRWMAPEALKNKEYSTKSGTFFTKDWV